MVGKALLQPLRRMMNQKKNPRVRGHTRAAEKTEVRAAAAAAAVSPS